MNREQALLGINNDGWCVLKNIIPLTEVDEIRDQVQQSVNHYRNPDAPRSIGHVSGFVRYDQSLIPYLADGRVMEIVTSLLGEYARVSFTSATINEPGNERGGWHADWPFNQTNAGCIKSPYADAVVHLTTIWMLVPFTISNGGTLVVLGSHRSPDNPTGGNGVPSHEPHPAEDQACGEAGSVLVMDSRLWHATAPNLSDHPRVAVVVRYAPWWLNLEILRPDSPERKRLLEETGRTENEVPSVPRAVFDSFPDPVKRLFAHWVESD